MALEVSSEKAICFRCGTAYGKYRGFFQVSYQDSHRGMGYLPICKNCVDKMYNNYLAQCKSARDAVRQVCRKLDLYWNDSIYDVVEKKSTTRSIMSQYISKLNTATYAGKSYDDTLSNEGTLWSFQSRAESDNAAIDNSAKKAPIVEGDDADDAMSEYIEELNNFKLTRDIITFWGLGRTKQMYAELERKREYWMSRLSADSDGADIAVGTEPLIKQICSLEVEIDEGRAKGDAVDSKVTLLNTLLGSANLKPTQKKTDGTGDLATAPLGVKIYNIEKHKPLPEGEERALKRAIKKYIWTWFGHICKLCNIKNGYTKMYEAEIERLRVKRPDLEDESDEDLIMSDLMDGDVPVQYNVQVVQDGEGVE